MTGTIEFLRGRDDAVVFGAQAVNAYVDEPRMTQDLDLLSPRAEALAQELRTYLHQRFHIAVRVRQVGVIALFPTACGAGRGNRRRHVSLASGRHKWGWQAGAHLVK